MSVKVPATRPKAHEQLARLAQQGDWPGALTLALAALRRWNDDLGLLEVGAEAARRTGRFDEAVRLRRRMLRADPYSLDLRLQLCGDLLDAGEAARAEVEFAPLMPAALRDPGARFLEARIAQALGRLEDACTGYQAVLDLAPQIPEAWLNLGTVQHALGRSQEAGASLRRAIALRPQWPRALSNLAAVLNEQRAPAEALAAAEAALSLEPTFLEARVNAGVSLRALGRFAEAAANFTAAAADAGPLGVRAATNLLALQASLGDDEGAERTAAALAAHVPEDPLWRFQWSLARLASRPDREAWALHESRRSPACAAAGLATAPASPPGVPEWQGEALEGRRLLVVPEQGLGDELQFLRFLPALRALAPAAIGLVCRPPLARLFALAEGVDEHVPAATLDQATDWDAWVPNMSLPHRLGLGADTQAQRLPLFRVPEAHAEAWSARLPGNGPRVGLAWRGSATHINDQYRSLAGAHVLSPLASVAGISWVNLQKDASVGELAAAAACGLPLVDPMPQVHDFLDTAALMQGIDLVISVDTSVVHLAGALGRECWVLLPAVGCDWRWGRSGEASAWYPRTHRIFRQPEPGRWHPVLEALVEALARRFAPD
jgi:tetratricopeptide (TPR) repeat protein